MRNQYQIVIKALGFLLKVLSIAMILAFVDAVFFNSFVLEWADRNWDFGGFLWYSMGISGRLVSFFITPFLGLWKVWFSIGQLGGIAVAIFLRLKFFST